MKKRFLNLLATSSTLLMAVACSKNSEPSKLLKGNGDDVVSTINIFCRQCVVNDPEDTGKPKTQYYTRNILESEYAAKKQLTWKFEVDSGKGLPQWLAVSYEGDEPASSHYDYKKDTGELTYTFETGDNYPTKINIIASATYECMDVTFLNESSGLLPEDYKHVGFTYEGGLDYVDWGDGVINNLSEHTYAADWTNETHIKIAGEHIDSISFSNPEYLNGEVVNYPIYEGNKYIRSVRYVSGGGITDIPAYAFSGCERLATIFVPDSITTIGKDAFPFNLEARTTIYTTSSTLKEKWDKSFDNLPVYWGYDPTYEEVTDVSGFKYIVSNRINPTTGVASPACVITGYNDNAVEELTIPAKLASDVNPLYIGAGAFAGFTKLKNITFASDIISIDNYAFYGCEVLNSFTPTVKPTFPLNIGKHAFENTYNMSSLNFSIGEEGTKDVNVTIDNYAFCNSKIQSLTTPTPHTYKYKITKIGDYAFNYCSSLNCVGEVGGDILYLPDSITEIGESAFFNCAGLAKVLFPSSFANTSIKKNAFESCNNATFLTALTSKPEKWDQNWNPSNRPITYGYTGAEAEVDGIKYCLQSTGNAYVASVVGLASTYASETTLTIKAEVEFNLPDSNGPVTAPVTSILNNAFSVSACSSILVAVDFETNDTYTTHPLTSVGGSAFESCTALANITLPSGVTSIGSKAFKSCSSLTNFALPAAINSIDKEAFAYCGFTLFQLPNVNYVGEDAFASYGRLIILATGESAGPNWDSNWNRQGHEVIWGYVNTVKESGVIYAIQNFAETGYQATALMSENHEAAMVEIRGAVSFTPEFGNPEPINVPVTAIASYAFSDMPNLNKVSIYADTSYTFHLKYIGHHAFYNCKALKEISLTKEVTYVGASAFEGCGGDSVFNIYFYGDAALTEGWDKNYGGEETGDVNKVALFTDVNNVRTDRADFDYYIHNSNGAHVTIFNYKVNPIPTQVTIPGTIDMGEGVIKTVTDIGAYTFYGKDGITDGIDYSNVTTSFTKIGDAAFADAYVKFTNLPNSVTTLGKSVFASGKLQTDKTVDLSNTAITKLPARAFANVGTFPKVALPSTLVSIEDKAFTNCGNLLEINLTEVTDRVVTLGRGVFDKVPNFEGPYPKAQGKVLVANAELVNAYALDETWLQNELYTHVMLP